MKHFLRIYYVKNTNINSTTTRDVVSVSRRRFQTSQSRLGLVKTWEGLSLDLVSDWKWNVSVLYNRVLFTCQYAQLFASLQNCTYIVLNARRQYCLLIHKLMSRLHPCCIHLQLQCSTHYSKSPFLDSANAKSLITSSKSSERSMSASMQSRDRESNLSWPIVVLVLDSSEYSVQALMVSVALYCLLCIILQHSNIIMAAQMRAFYFHPVVSSSFFFYLA